MSAALTIPGTEGELKSEDIEVWVNDVGKFDQNVKDIEIVVIAQPYPEREQNLKERQEAIENPVKAILNWENDGFVWMLLAKKGAFGEFKKLPK